MIQPTQDELRALMNLTSNPDFVSFFTWLQNSLVRQSLDLNQARAEDTERLKGRNNELSDLIDYCRNAKEHFERSKEPPKGIV